MQRGRGHWAQRQSAPQTRHGIRSVLLALGCVAALVVGCASTTTHHGPPPALPDAQQVFHGQVVGVADIKTLDPALAQDAYSEAQVQLIFPGLVTLDSALNVVPWAAIALPSITNGGITNQGTTYTFHLRKGMKWSDGTPITASDFAYAINRTEDPCLSSPVAYYLYVLANAQDYNLGDQCADPTHDTVSGVYPSLIGPGRAIVVVDPLTLQLNLSRPASYFLDALSYSTSYAVPQHLIVNSDGSINTDWATKLTAHAGGFGGNLYNVTSWVHGKQIVLDRNPMFWGAKPKLREISLTIYQDATTAYSRYLAGADEIGSAPVTALPGARKRPGFHEFGALQIDYLASNWSIAPFDNFVARQAFAIALDKTKLVAGDNGAATATNHIIPQGMPGYNPKLDGPDGTQSLTGDPTTARTLAQSYANAKCDGSFAQCPAVTLTIIKGSQSILNEATAMVKMWQKAFPKWPISLNAVDFSTLNNELGLRAVQFWYTAWIADYPDPQDVLSLAFLPENSYDGIGDDPPADTLMRAADANPDLVGRLAQYQQAEQSEVSDIAWIPLDQANGWYEVRANVINLTVNADGLVPLPIWQQVYLTKS